ncbi:MAG TPA: RNA 2',3'-cyclic phosphodiesterase [Sedimentisphaerales bacterium]|nr:RNA 2',3'-cyclic phosphodiesterase [Sedimentisphaerales bacterium]
MRCFIAIDIDDKIRNALGDLQHQLENASGIKKGDVKWVEPQNIHLTLKFLGEITDPETVEVCNIVKDLVAGHKSFALDVESVGCFGGRSARVLWVGTSAAGDDLLRLQSDLDDRLAQAGWPKEERPFTGHLTLCRVRNPGAGVKLAQTSSQYKDLKVGTVLVDSVCIYQSQLTPKGPLYTLLADYKLQ